MRIENFGVVIIGAGPSGSVAAALLKKQGVNPVILEQEEFPRFSIGESLLPQCMPILNNAGLFDVIKEHGFQNKNGAAFQKGADYTYFDFREKFSNGPGTTFQVQREKFDHLLANEVAEQGVEIRYQHSVLNVVENDNSMLLQVQNLKTSEIYQVNCTVLLDASGFGRVLPRLLDLHLPSEMPVRSSYFAHFKDNITCDKYDREKILVGIHPKFNDLWYWLIPFENGDASVGVVGNPDYFKHQKNMSNTDILLYWVKELPRLKELLANAKPKFDVRLLNGYSANVKKLAGNNFALLGNAGEFLDPVFSSGVTIALKSAELAVPQVLKVLEGKNVDWDSNYCEPLKKGVNVFRAFVNAWYDGRLQKIFFHEKQSTDIKRMIASILAGYAWDEKNPYCQNTEKRLNTLVELCS